MTKVFIRKASYEADILRSMIHEMLDSRGPDWIKAGARVVVKPNLLLPAPPEKAIVTHPLIARAVAEYLLDRGAKVQISDSPPIGSFHKLLRESGYHEAFEGLDVDLKPFADSVQVDVGEPFGTIEIARDAMQADIVINLAKLKSHVQMYLTLGVKNIFGTVVGLRKPEWHMRAGVDRLMFAKLLVQIYQAVAPSFTIVDGILALEGQGPGKSGKPRELGLLVGGANAHAVDKTICTLLGLEPNELLTYRLARDLNLFDGQVHVNGNIDIVDEFIFPELHSLSMGSESLNRFMRKYVIQKPVVDDQLCKLCGECWKICPAKVISHNIKTIRFDYDRCIRCYCCLEVCGEGAIRAKEPLLGKVRRRLIKEKQPQELKKKADEGPKAE
jgi:uncharacterized protein (DUF362 family)/NAD-dependent dihydropyrimidine dehydrogenase PreA subunit